MPFYISPTGNDTWFGTLHEPNANCTDGPFATLAAAQRAVRALPRDAAWTAPVVVYLRGGLYLLDEPLVFTAEDSGQAEEYKWRSDQAHPVSYIAYPGETPVISGGRRISGWRVETVHGQTAWVADVPDADFRQLWVNGTRRYRPRLPKTGEYRIEVPYDARFEGSWGETVRGGTTRFGYAEGNICADWHNLSDVEVQFFTLWMSVRARLTAVDPATRIATFDCDSKLRLTYDFTSDGAAYIIENIFEALEEPGQWYLDRPAGRLYYLPLPGEDLSSAEVIAPVLATLVHLDGSDDAPVHDITFTGLTFAHTEWLPAPDEIYPMQAEPKVPGAVVARGAVHCHFDHCAFTHLGGYAVDLVEACRDIAIERCAMTDLGAGGVKIWHGCTRTLVADCEIGDGGIIFPAAIGVLIGKSSGNRILHNHIHDLYYSGVSAGWTWGYAEGDAYGNIIEWNHIHDLGKGLLSDMGGVYLLGAQPGTRVRYNHIHHVTSRTYGGWALYTDEGSSHILLEYNICHDTSKQGFHQHYGRENVIRNNVFAFGGESMLLYSRAEPHTGFTFTRNLVISDGVPMWQGDYAPATHRINCDDNLYWDVAGTPVLDQHGDQSLDITAWQALGHDCHSHVADPKCANLAARDFTPAAGSPLLTLGFIPVDLSLTGPREEISG